MPKCTRVLTASARPVLNLIGQRFEQPVNLEEVLPFIQQGDLVLWDCVTTWLANELYAGWETGNTVHQTAKLYGTKRRYNCMKQLMRFYSKLDHLVIVSNEVLDELPSSYEGDPNVSEWLGRIHQKLVEQADTAIEMEYGLATFWKKERSKMNGIIVLGTASDSGKTMICTALCRL